MRTQPGLIWGLFTIGQIICTRQQTICTIQHAQYSKPRAQYSKTCAQKWQAVCTIRQSKPHPLSEHLRETPTSYASV